ncbi:MULTISPECIES: ABC transporter substrate-binding protein [Thalassospira]|uniref:Sugar ABC transporter substrate-binding protein n=1 Tax=Thalassospira lucentensis TaxID=168935 RepID=A0A358HUH6_9PROT|nr:MULTISPECIES: sugar ABC transporter substrate-binding protein [Thalassospira]MBV18083.1 sugar ABC transporter substrate-binding protein [Thalassospira sp.]HBU98632.1 sugar ABC transporter substrate-binding protein [Thalassospira lucentensis]HCW68462.1 sugar ABC transporter substrate-binding protein [Thalassospira lucentensis]|tara:strand:- start:20789 stop:22102 length:1314 start_codon:yes stop_codon:yes gene_type:complete
MKRVMGAALCALLAGGVAFTANAETKLTIATVNNGDMIRMQKLTDDFTSQNPDISLEWVTLEENTLRQRVTTDIATKGGQYDIMTIGTYEVPIWAEKGWLAPLDNLGADYDVDDLMPAIRAAVSKDDALYAAPFYGESSMMMYRKDLFEKAGIEVNGRLTWDQTLDIAKKLHDPDNGVYGICLRGKAGWGENMALISTMGNAYGARWFDEEWNPTFDGPEWKAALDMYTNILGNYGPPGATSNGFNENLSLFNSGKCGMWIDATVAASFVTNPKESKVADQVAFTEAPCAVTCTGANWLWAWNLGIPMGSQNVEAAQKFIAWATSKEYLELVASKEGWANVPPGTRISLYENPKYLEAAPFADETLLAIDSADPINSTLKPKPYVGVQFAAIPEFQGIGTTVGQQFSAALAGQSTVEEALSAAQASTDRTMRKAGYY